MFLHMKRDIVARAVDPKSRKSGLESCFDVSNSEHIHSL